MAIRADNSNPINLNSLDRFSNKTEIRSFLLNQWITEMPTSKYRYFVETISNGNRIYLERPGRLNKGCDFVIFIENQILFYNGNDKPPKHDFILEDLEYKKQNLSNEHYQNLILSITDIYNCLPVPIALNRLQQQPNVSESYELVLKLVKWFFIEQDITYWAKSGRQMLFDAIRSI